MSSAVGDHTGVITLVRKGGKGKAIVRKVTTGFTSRASCRTTDVVMALIVAQLGAYTSFIMRIDFGQFSTEISHSLNPERPKYSRGLRRFPLTMEI